MSEASDKAVQRWLKETDWWVVSGTTGSGKTYFVEQLKSIISANGWPVVYVPQFPMFKPQLKVTRFVRLLPLSSAARRDLVADLELLGVPTESYIGGKLMGMLDIPGLSGGERKKMLIAISVAIAMHFQCPFMVMDEPFAGIDSDGMGDVIKIMEKASKAVPGLKCIIVTHDHFSKLPSSASVIEVDDRKVSGQGGVYKAGNGEAAAVFAASMLTNATARPKKRPIFDFYLVKRHFIEKEFGIPLMCTIMFAVMLGLAAVNVAVPLPGFIMNKEGAYVFLKGFMVVYPHFGGVINYCFKRGQHMEDFYLNITNSEFAVAETIVISVLQMSVICAISTAIMVGLSDFWWIGLDAVWVDICFAVWNTIGWLLFPIICPNPVLAMLGVLPYVCSTIILGGMLTPREDCWPGIKWFMYTSPTWQMGCLYSKLSDKIVLSRAECVDSLAFHLIFVDPWVYLVLTGVAVKIFLARRDARRLRIGAPSGGAPVAVAAAAVAAEEVPVKRASGLRRTVTFVAPAQRKVDVKEWLEGDTWWIVQGRTGAGKTYFVQQLTKCLYNLGREVVFIPQFPMNKPQLTVRRFLSLLPLKAELRAELMESLAEMEVPTTGKVGGAFAGMVNVRGLSGGQRKKLLIAVAVAIVGNFGCTHVVMDEPFAGINAGSMASVMAVLKKAIRRVPDIKFFIVTHDHAQSLSQSAAVLQVDDRKVYGFNGYQAGNMEAAAEIAQKWTEAVKAPVSKRPFIDLFIVKSHFVEQEWLVPLATYILFGALLACTLTEHEGELPGYIGLDMVFTFLKVFVIEYPSFSSIIQYCYKRGQHQEDFGLGISGSRLGIAELIIAGALQQTVLVILFDALICAIDQFWWINIQIVLIDVLYGVVSIAAYYMLPIIIPNPIIAMTSMFPYAVVWAFLNGVILPRSEFWDPIEWVPVISPIHNLGCAYTFASDKKIRLSGTKCFDSIVPHLFLMPSLFWVVLIALVIKLLLELRTSRTKAAKATKATGAIGSEVSI